MDTLELYIITPTSNTVFVTIDAPLLDLEEEQELEIFPGEVTRVELPVEIAATDSGIHDTGVYVTASDDILLYGLNIDEGSCGGFQIMPKDAIGFNYYVMSSLPVIPQTDGYSELVVVATEDDTEVTLLIPSGVSIELEGNTYDENNPIKITLDKFQTYELQSEDFLDLTGIRVSGTKLIAVFSGVRNLQTAQDPFNADYVIEQMIPLHSWGTRFGIVPFPDGEDGYFVNYVTREPDTVVVINGDVYEVENAGSFQARGLPFSKGDYVGIESSKPILVGQILASQRSDRDGAPAFLMVPPTQQFKTDYYFAVPEASDGSYDVFLMLVINEGQESGLRLDDESLDEFWTVIPESSPTLIGTWLAISTGESHRVYHIDDAKFEASVYGHDDFSCAFAYMADMCLEDIRPVS